MRDTLQTEIGPFASVPAWVIDACGDANGLAVYVVLARHANRERRAWPGQDRIAAKLGTSVSTVQRAMKLLRDIGAIATEARRQGGVIVGTSYVLLAKSSIKPHTSQVTGRAQPAAVELGSGTSLDVTGDGDHTSQVTDKQDPSNKIKRAEEDPLREAAAIEAVEAVVQHWRNGWKLSYGHEPTLIMKPITIAHVGEQVRKIGRAGCEAALDAFFANGDDYVRKTRHSLALWAGDPNRWVAKEAKAAAATTANGVRRQTHEANAGHVADGRMHGILARDNPESFH